MKKILFDILYFIYYKLKNLITKKNRYKYYLVILINLINLFSLFFKIYII